MFNPKYKGGQRVPEGGTKFYVMRNGHFVREVVVPYLYFPHLEDKDLYYIKYC